MAGHLVRYLTIIAALGWNLPGTNTQDPTITSFFPTYGPVSGETLVFFNGSNFGDGTHSNTSVVVTIGNLPCKLRASNAKSIFCATSKLSDLSSLGQPLAINVAIDNGRQPVPNSFTFTYRPDPIIEDFYPRRTIEHGGLIMTVTGRNLDSIFLPILMVSISWNGISPESSPAKKDCQQPVNATTMFCPTPFLNLHNIAPSRTSHLISGEFLKFSIGFHLDGVKKYENLTGTTLSDKSLLEVYKNPEVQKFKESCGNDICIFKTYETDVISFAGTGLRDPLDEDDYEITIGTTPCNITELYTNRITCKPPGEQPELTPDTNQRDGAIQVVVKVGTGNLRFSPGYLQWQHYDPWIIAGPVIAVVALLLIGVAGICFVRNRRRNEQQSSSYPSGHVYGPSFDLMTELDDDLKVQIQSLLIDSDLIREGQLLGSGQYGAVHYGEMLDSRGSPKQAVAIKSVKDNHANLSDVEDFLREATIMKDFHHVNILSILGVAIKNNKPLVLLPYMENGDLKTYISKNHPHMKQLVNFAWQVACGMAYLEMHRCVHRDLAMRNCMVSGELVVKVADFGLARDIYERDYYRADQQKGRSLPVKWMALECLEGQVFTTKSDVWSFGVLLWELMTCGKTPYPDVDYIDMRRYLRKGRRLDRPPGTPDAVFSVMQHCWTYNPAGRPSFAELTDIMKQILLGKQFSSGDTGNYITVMNSARPEPVGNPYAV